MQVVRLLFGTDLILEFYKMTDHIGYLYTITVFGGGVIGYLKSSKYID